MLKIPSFMKSVILLFVILLLGIIPSGVQGQQYIPTILVEYDNAGNRVLRKLENVCYGCPKPAPRLIQLILKILEQLRHMGRSVTVLNGSG